MAADTENGFSGPFIPNGATTVFPFPFTAPSAAEVSVFLRAADGTETDAAGFTVTLTPGGGGNVTFAVAPPAGPELYILLAPNFTQDVQFENGSAWLAEPVNEVADRAAARDQAMKREIDRSLRVPLGETPPEGGSFAGNLTGKAIGFVNGKMVPVPNDASTAAELLTDVQDVAEEVDQDKQATETARDLTLGYAEAAAAQPGLAAAQVVLATAEKTAAALAKTQAEYAALAATALSNDKVYLTTGAGIADTVDTNPFMVPDGSTGNLALWLNVSGVATAVGTPQFKLLGVEGYAALAGQAPAYTNAGGQGDRTATVTVTAIGITASGGTPDNLVDGVAASTTGDGYRLPGSTAVAGMRLRFDFGAGARKNITEATFKFQSTNSLATWKWSASNDLTTFTDIGANLTLASATTQVMTELSANRLGYRYYDLVAVSGSTHATVNYIQEAEFKIAATDADGIPALPPGGTADQTLRKNGTANGASEWIDPKEPPGRSLFNHLWPCDEGHGTILRDVIGNVHFNLAGGATEVNIGSGGSIAWGGGELVLTYAAISTLASGTAPTTILICEPVVDAAHYAIGLGNSNNQM